MWLHAGLVIAGVICVSAFGIEPRPPAESTAKELDDLEAWNRYLAALHAEDAAGRIEQGRDYT